MVDVVSQIGARSATPRVDSTRRPARVQSVAHRFGVERGWNARGAVGTGAPLEPETDEWSRSASAALAALALPLCPRNPWQVSKVPNDLWPRRQRCAIARRGYVAESPHGRLPENRSLGQLSEAPPFFPDVALVSCSFEPRGMPRCGKRRVREPGELQFSREHSNRRNRPSCRADAFLQYIGCLIFMNLAAVCCCRLALA